MAAIVVKSFNGLKPIVSNKLLGATDAQVATNVRLISGALVPLKASTNLKATSNNPKTIHPYGGTSGEDATWLEFSQDTDVMRSPIAGDTWSRLYWTNGDNPPRYAPNSLILQAGTGAYPRASYQLGIPKPGSSITVSSFTAPTTYTRSTREYCMTFYNPTSSKESLPTSTLAVQGVDGQKISFTGLTTDNKGDSGVTKKRIYRKVSGTFRRIVELDLSTTTYDDETTDAAAASLPTFSSNGVYVPVPTRAPSVSAPTAQNLSAGSYQYVYTVVNFTVAQVSGEGNTSYYNYQSTPPSPAVTISADKTQTVTISGLANTVSGVTGQYFRIYRKDPGATQYLLVAQIPVSQTSYQDVLATTTLGETLSYDYSTGPSSAPSASANSSTYTTAVRRVYMVTWVDGSNNESSKGPVSSVILVNDGATSVTVTHAESAPTGVVKKRLYRQTVTVSGSTISMSDANWKLVAEGTAATTSYVDVAADSTLSTTLASGLRDLPPVPGGTPGYNAVIPPDTVPETRVYTYTYVSAYDEEGPPADASASVSMDPEGQAVLSVSSTAPTGSYNITKKRIYRSSTVGSNAQFQFVAEIPLATGSYTDTKAQSDLGEVLPSEDWVAPPSGLKGLRLMANGVAVGFKGRTVYFSEPNLPHAWPHEYNIDEDIVGIATFGQTVAVMTAGYPRVFQGIDPAAMAETKLLLPQACVSKRSIIETGDGAVYASADGLVSIGSATDVVTKNILSRAQWQAYKPESMESYIYNGRLHIIYDTGTAKGVLIFDFTGQGAAFTTSDINASSQITAGYYDPRSDILYFHQGGYIKRLDQGSALTMTWRSKVNRLEMPVNFSCAQVIAESYPVTFKLYCDGQLKQTKTVSNNNLFRLPSGFRAYDWEFQLEGATEVNAVGIATSALELKSI